jgi:UDP-glucose 4-epimerase
MTYLVTGGGGFIGSNLVEALLRRGRSVRVLDNFATGRRENLRETDPWCRAGGGTFELVEGDIRNEADLARALEGVEIVLHQAAIPSVARSVKDPLTSHTVKVDGTLKLLLACRDRNVKRLVFASSSSVYGETEVLPKVETMPTAPVSPYALDKLAGETYWRLFHRLFGLPTIALRYFNVFGPRQDPASDYAAVIPKFITLMASGRPATIEGDGRQSRDFTFVENVVAGNLAAAEAPESACGEVYNVACGDRMDLLALVSYLNESLGTNLEPTFGPPRPGDVRHSQAGIDRAREAFGYEPLVSTAEGLRRTVEHLVEGGGNP